MLLIRGVQGITERTSLNWLFDVSSMVFMLPSCVWGCSVFPERWLVRQCKSARTEARISGCEWFQRLKSSLQCCGVGAIVDSKNGFTQTLFAFEGPP